MFQNRNLTYGRYYSLLNIGNIILFWVSKYTIWDIRNLSKVLFSLKNPNSIRLKGSSSRADKAWQVPQTMSIVHASFCGGGSSCPHLNSKDAYITPRKSNNQHYRIHPWWHLDQSSLHLWSNTHQTRPILTTSQNNLKTIPQPWSHPTPLLSPMLKYIIRLSFNWNPYPN